MENNFWVCYAFETARDLLLKKKPGVINILTNADLSQISKLFSDISFRKNSDEHAYYNNGGYPVRFYTVDHGETGSLNATFSDESKKNALKKAVEYSLFSVNCFFYDLEGEMFYDPLGAYPLLKRGIIKTVKNHEETAEIAPAFALKTAKVFSETGFEIDKSLRRFLKRNEQFHGYKEIDKVIAGDFLDICISGRAYEALTFLDEWNILELLLPEVSVLKNVNQDKDHHPEGNGFRHTLSCLRFVKKPNKNLMMAILLHDTGKAVTATNHKNGKAFPNHSSASKTIAKKVLSRFYYKSEEMDEIFFLIKNHMILDAVDRLPQSRLRSLFSSPYFSNLLELYRADLESGYHKIDSYYNTARKYKEFLRRERLKRQGIYL
jgi:tRNA nucleotidyltransferase/poly(A) polymerase